MAMGCPHSKNKDIDNVNLHIRAIIWKYSATAVVDAKLAKKGWALPEKSAYLIKFDKKMLLKMRMVGASTRSIPAG